MESWDDTVSSTPIDTTIKQPGVRLRARNQQILPG
jgi:hypothetical protein